MKMNCLFTIFGLIVTLQLVLLMMGGCTGTKSERHEIESIVRRYNDLVAEGYRNQDMNPLQEVTTREQAVKLYHHMSALGEGKLRMESTLRDIKFKKLEQLDRMQATVETEEVWDFTHYRMDSGEKFADEKDFVYRMGYVLNKQGGSWIITNVNTLGGTSTNSVIPWPELDRHGNTINLPPSTAATAPSSRQ